MIEQKEKHTDKEGKGIPSIFSREYCLLCSLMFVFSLLHHSVLRNRSKVTTVISVLLSLFWVCDFFNETKDEMKKMKILLVLGTDHDVLLQTSFSLV